MGIAGLLKLLSPVTKRIHISEYANKRIAIDGYCWLHKAVYSCSQELCMNIPTTKFINYCISLINMLKQNKVIPVIVFDGGALPNKKVTEDERRGKREHMKAMAHAYLMEGNAAEANRCFQKAVDVTPTMAFLLIKVLRQMNIEYLVAPYEADAQLAYLAVTGQVDAVLTEDSDLVAYGTPNVNIYQFT
ncbi:5'3'-exonuclease N- and I-domain-containing protein [Heterostelium album PN500]|uniref:5'3'-exonuclease N-and I-domain-containing protein n=1 Tax=Heterostelium pallidum (strain ATCC 26659 / Pp 5 / PN500) TaxID=670386 RepID=D3BQQ5_HETP5|nr:5'3'-exonuclease N- and I-domain-containing protein [Heterostelium album PN500]EFA76475.1 5'3'-exonuclease N- and I-domain-containing protein [Heterostelium album PN500]|eukprot:XP_020428607.1 5'3'-exonuclease N- and I-domain-containing protein [Heterostelium album PN500]